jgi:hypothetical protein
MFSSYSSPLNTIPSQMKSLKEKFANKKDWAKKCVDAYENIGRVQYYDNMRFVENYKMVNGQFIMSHYMQDSGYQDLLSALSQEFEIPSTLRHYDILGKVLNNLTEKLAEFPDVFRVEEKYEEDENNEFVRTQTEMLQQSVKADIMNEIRANLIKQGIDPDKQDFASEEEAMQYYEEMQKMQQAMTPEQIEKYMQTEWQGQGEIWGSHQLEVDKQKFNLEELERVEFRDMLITDRCFRHYYLTADGYDQETWNPVNTFVHVSPEIKWSDEGDFVGRMFYLTKSQIIDRYGWKMTAKEMKKLEELDSQEDTKTDMTGFPYKAYVPFEDFKPYELIRRHTGYDPIQRLPLLGDDMVNALTNTGRMPFFENYNGLYRVTEVYWMSQKKYGKVVYRDPLTDQLVSETVDEHFVVPEGFKEILGNYHDGDKENTVYWTWINETWKGIKICFTLNDTEALYLDLGPADFQFKSDMNPYGAKLPVCGRVFNNRNAQSMSLVDLMKPHQIGYNVCMNQLYQLLEKEIGKFIVWDANFFNTMKDWGGEDSWEKITILAKELGHVFGDTSPQNMKGANQNNSLPRAVDMELTSQMFSRAKLAEFFEARALSQLGISQQLMADVKATETATGINTAVSQSTLNVQRFYTDFMEYKKRCLSMNLDIAQYVQSRNKDITIMYTKSDASRVFIRMNGTDLLLRNMHVYVVNSQSLLRQLEQIKNYFVNNNTLAVSALDIVEVITSNSPSAIKAKLKEVVEKTELMENQKMQMQQQQIDQQAEVAQMQEDREDARQAAANQTKKEVAYIQTFNRQQNNVPDADNSGTPDSLEYNKFAAQTSADQAKIAVQKEANQIKREQSAQSNSIKQKELELKKDALTVKKAETRARKYVANKNKNQYDK